MMTMISPKSTPLLPSLVDLVPPFATSSGSPLTTTAVAGNSLSSASDSCVWRDLFSASRPSAPYTNSKISHSIISLKHVPSHLKTSNLSLKSGTCVRLVMSLVRALVIGP
jgi:hypothetical protein